MLPTLDAPLPRGRAQPAARRHHAARKARRPSCSAGRRPASCAAPGATAPSRARATARAARSASASSSARSSLPWTATAPRRAARPASGRYASTLAYAVENGKLKALSNGARASAERPSLQGPPAEQQPVKGGLRIGRGPCARDAARLGEYVKVAAENCAAAMRLQALFRADARRPARRLPAAAPGGEVAWPGRSSSASRRTRSSPRRARSSRAPRRRSARRRTRRPRRSTSRCPARCRC